MDKKTFAIGVLSITAAILFVAQFLPLGGQPATAGEAVRDPATEFQMVTARNVSGGESLYILNRDGRLVVMQYDPNTRALRPMGGRDIPSIFSGGR